METLPVAVITLPPGEILKWHLFRGTLLFIGIYAAPAEARRPVPAELWMRGSLLALWPQGALKQVLPHFLRPRVGTVRYTRGCPWRLSAWCSRGPFPGLQVLLVEEWGRAHGSGEESPLLCKPKVPRTLQVVELARAPSSTFSTRSHTSSRNSAVPQRNRLQNTSHFKSLLAMLST